MSKTVYRWMDYMGKPPTIGVQVQLRRDCTDGENGRMFLELGHGTPGGISGGPSPMYSQSRCVKNLRVCSVIHREPENGEPWWEIIAE